MDKRLLDPRRARRAPTAEDRAEQLAPYSEELPVAPPGYATFDRQVANLRGAARVSILWHTEGCTCLFADGGCGAVVWHILLMCSRRVLHIVSPLIDTALLSHCACAVGLTGSICCRWLPTTGSCRPAMAIKCIWYVHWCDRLRRAFPDFSF